MQRIKKLYSIASITKNKKNVVPEVIQRKVPPPLVSPPPVVTIPPQVQTSRCNETLGPSIGTQRQGSRSVSNRKRTKRKSSTNKGGNSRLSQASEHLKKTSGKLILGDEAWFRPSRK